MIVPYAWNCAICLLAGLGSYLGVEAVKLGAIIPFTSFYKNDLNSAVLKTELKLKKENRLLLGGKFQNTALSYMSNFNPREILDTFCKDLLGNGIDAIVILNNPSIFRSYIALDSYIYQLADSLSTPVISWNRDHSGSASSISKNALILELAPSIHHQVTALFSILQKYSWPAFSVVTTTHTGYTDFINSIHDLTRRASEYPDIGVASENGQLIRYEIITEITLMNRTVASMRERLTELKKIDTRIILLYASRLDSMTIFDVAKELGIIGPEYMWLVTTATIGGKTSGPTSFPTGLLGVQYSTGLPQMISALTNAIKIWVKAQENILNDKVLGIDDLQPKNMSCTNKTPMQWRYGRILYEYMKNVSLTDTDPPIEFKEDGSLKYTKLTIVNLNSRRLWKEIGTWDHRGMRIEDITWPGNRTQPPKGKPRKYRVRVMTLKEKPYVNYDDIGIEGSCASRRGIVCQVYNRIGRKGTPNATTDGTIDKCCTGLSIDLLITISVSIGFDVELIEVEDGLWGAIDRKTGEMNGLVRALMDGKCDMVMTSLKIIPERSIHVDFSLPYLETGISIVVAIREGAISPTAFLEPYDYPSWCLILVFSVHATGTAVFVFEWLSPKGLNQGKTPIREHKFSLFRSFWLIWAMLFQATVSVDNPRGASSRFLSNIWALFAMVFLASYTANLAAFMITKEDFYDLSGIQDIRLTNPESVKPPFRFATVPFGSTETNLQKNYKDIFEYMKQFHQTTVEDGIHALKKNVINAFIYDATVLEYWAGHDKDCKLRTVGNWYAMTGYGVAFPKKSKWIEPINQVILNLQERGEMDRLQRFWSSGACKLGHEEGQSSHSLGILNFTSAFILLAGGMFFGALLLMLEHLYFRFGRKKLRKWDKWGCCGLISLSMGKSLTFEQSVIEAIEFHKSHKCKDPICEIQFWKVRHELDLALLKVDQLQSRLESRGEKPSGKAMWKLANHAARPAIGNAPHTHTSSTDQKHSPVHQTISNDLRTGETNKNQKNISNQLVDDTRQRQRNEFEKPDSVDSNSKGPEELDSDWRNVSLRRSPSYTTAMGNNNKDGSPMKVRYYNGNCYTEVSKGDSESNL